jgi:hypothetical protein
VIAGSGPASVIKHGEPQLKKIVSPGFDVLMAFRKSPTAPAPVPAAPPELLSVFNVTVNVPAIAMCAQATTIATHKINRFIQKSSDSLASHRQRPEREVTIAGNTTRMDLRVNVSLDTLQC